MPLPTLRAAFARVKANRGAAGVDHVTVAMYEARLDANLAALSTALRDGTVPSAADPTALDSERPARAAAARDSDGARPRRANRPASGPGTDLRRDVCPAQLWLSPGRGAKDALRRVDALAARGLSLRRGCGPPGYFDTIPHAPLRARVASKVSDSRVLALVDAFLQQPIFEGLAQWTLDEGTPQGAVISPLLANLYLDPLDHAMAAAGFEMVRYADDFVILCRTAEEAQQALSDRPTLDGGGGFAAASRENASRGSAAARRL